MKIAKILFKIFAGKGYIMSLGLILTVLSFSSSLGLLTLSAWFLASCYIIHSIDFNFFYPSSSVRGFAIARTFFKYVQRLITHKATFDILTKLRVQIFAGILPLAVEQEKLEKLKQSQAITDNDLFDRIIKDIDLIDGFYVNVLIPFFGSLITFIIFTIGLSFIDLQLALVVGGVMILTTLIVPWIFYPLGTKVSDKIDTRRKQVRLTFLNFLEQQLEHQIFAKTSEKLEKLQKANKELIAEQLVLDKYVSTIVLVMQLILGGLLTFTIFAASHLWVLDSTDLRLPGLAALFVFIIVGAIEIIIPLAGLFVNLGQVVTAAKNLAPLLDNPNAFNLTNELIAEVNEKPVTQQADTSGIYPELLSNAELEQIKQVKVKISNLQLFKGEREIIQDLNYEFAPNTSYLIRGESGVGKSSLLNCILGLDQTYSEQSKVEILALDSQGNPDLVLEAKQGRQRQLIAYLSQRVHIFTDSLRSNLKIANGQATDEEIKAVLKLLNLDYLELEQIIGNGGRVLSGGEIRRIGVARVLLSPAKLFILDEPTESLDGDSEALVLEAIFAHAKRQQATVILVSHKQTNYKYCDKVLRMLKPGVLESVDN